MKCLACGRDGDGEEIYPYPDDNVCTDHPVPKLVCVEAEDAETEEFRMAVFCNHCWHKMDPDMWISRRCWESLDPQTPYKDLPPLKMLGKDRIDRNPRSYF